MWLHLFFRLYLLETPSGDELLTGAHFSGSPHDCHVGPELCQVLQAALLLLAAPVLTLHLGQHVAVELALLRLLQPLFVRMVVGVDVVVELLVLGVLLVAQVAVEIGLEGGQGLLDYFLFLLNSLVLLLEFFCFLLFNFQCSPLLCCLLSVVHFHLHSSKSHDIFLDDDREGVSASLQVLAEALAGLPAMSEQQPVAQIVLRDGLGQRSLLKLDEVVIVNVNSFTLVVSSFVKPRKLLRHLIT